MLISNGTELNNYALCYIAEYYACILASKEYNCRYIVYNDIPEDYKISHGLSKYDTGIDMMNMDGGYGQVKLYNSSISLRSVATFFAHMYYREPSQAILAYNHGVKLSSHVERFIDGGKCGPLVYNRDEMIQYCNDLMTRRKEFDNIINPPNIHKREVYEDQVECIDFLKSNNKAIICMPTGTGKSYIMSQYMRNLDMEREKIIIFVPRIVLMEQMRDEILKEFGKEYNAKIQCVGDNGLKQLNDGVRIVICVYNSARHMVEYKDSMTRMICDEAHMVFGYSGYDIFDGYVEDSLEYVRDGKDADGKEVNEIIDEDDGDGDDNTEISNDTPENDIKLSTRYNDIIRNWFNTSPNALLFSATIDDMKGVPYFKKNMRDMIDAGRLTPYNIIFPVSNDKEQLVYKTCHYLVRDTSHIIVFTRFRWEGAHVCELLNKLQNGCAKYVDCSTPTGQRKKIEAEFREGHLKFLVNVRVYSMGFDAPITNGICLLHVPLNEYDIIQRIGRALRKHPLKTVAHIIVPITTQNEDERVKLILKAISGEDPKCKQLLDTKKRGLVECVNLNGNNITPELEFDNNTEFDERIIYDYYGNCLSGIERWKTKLENLIKYINENNCLPNKRSKHTQVKILSVWLYYQRQNYKYNNEIMRNETVRKIWEQFIQDYKKYFMSNVEKWNHHLIELKTYINKHNILPSSHSKVAEVLQIARWLYNQKYSYKMKNMSMNDPVILKQWEDFMEEYKSYFVSIHSVWISHLEDLKQYIDTHNTLPTTRMTDPHTRQLGKWINMQFMNYRKKQRSIMDPVLLEQWHKFIEEYKERIMTDDEIWFYRLEEVVYYIKINNKTPSQDDDNEHNKCLAKWIIQQKQDYNTTGIMQKPSIMEMWKLAAKKYNI